MWVRVSNGFSGAGEATFRLPLDLLSKAKVLHTYSCSPYIAQRLNIFKIEKLLERQPGSSTEFMAELQLA